MIGCSGSYPGPDSPACCYLLEADDPDGRTWRVLLDLGNGALGALHNYVDPLSVDGVLVSHLHADHCLDLCGYYVLRKYHPQGPQPPIPVWGPAGIADRMARAYDLPLDPGMREEFDFREYDGPFDLGPFAVEPIAGRPPGAGLRAPGQRRRRDPRLQRRHRAVRGPRPGRRRRPLLLAEASFRSERRQPAPPAPDRRRLRRRSPTGRRRRGWCSPTSRRGTTATWRWPRPTAAYAGAIELARPGAVYEL